jgi:hypothetical protein
MREIRSTPLGGLTSIAVLGCVAVVSFGVVEVGQAAPKAKAARPSARCAALSREITGSVQEMAMLKAGDIGDNSAPRAAMRAGQISNQQSQIQNNILLMRSEGCAPYSKTLNPDAYLLPAIECRTAMLDRQNDATAARLSNQPAPADAGLLPACDTTKWVAGLR